MSQERTFRCNLKEGPKGKRRVLVALVVLLTLPASLLGLIRLAEAQTTVDVKNEGRDITITMPIDVATNDPKIAEQWKKDAEDKWNDAFKNSHNPYKGCLNLKLKLDIKAVPSDALPREGRHEIYDWPTTDPDTHGSILDSDLDPYKMPRDGYFDPTFKNQGGGVRVAHEVGHLMGLHDEYHEVSKHPRKTEPNRGREGTLMAGCKDNTHPCPYTIDDTLIRSLVARIRKETDKVRDCPGVGRGAGSPSQETGDRSPESGGCGAPPPQCGTGLTWCPKEGRCAPLDYFDCNRCGCGQCR